MANPTRTHPHVATAGSLAVGNTSIDDVLDITLQPPSKVLEHGGSSGKYDVLSKTQPIDLSAEYYKPSQTSSHDSPCKALFGHQSDWSG